MSQEAEFLPPAPALHGDNREEAGGQTWRGKQEKILGCMGGMSRSSSSPGDPPVPHHVDGLDARGPGDLDDSLAHPTVGSVLDDRVTWR